jgi:hypothetical protein
MYHPRAVIRRIVGAFGDFFNMGLYSLGEFERIAHDCMISYLLSSFFLTNIKNVLNIHLLTIH